MTRILLQAQVQNASGFIEPSPARDAHLRGRIMEFAAGTITSDQIGDELLNYWQHFETHPYKIGLHVDWQAVPQRCIVEIVHHTAHYIGPPIKAFLKGEPHGVRNGCEGRTVLLLLPPGKCNRITGQLLHREF